MNNIEAMDRTVDQGGTVAKLFWIAVSIESGELKEHLEDLQGKDFKACFPKVAEYYKDYKRDNNLVQALNDGNYRGFLAEVHVDESFDFRFDAQGVRTAWGSGRSKYVHHVYAETLEALVTEIERVTSEDLARDEADARKAQGIPAPAEA